MRSDEPSESMHWALRVIPTMAVTVSRTPVLVYHPSFEVTHISWAFDSSPWPSRAVTAAT
jgi:hypothetical protein